MMDCARNHKHTITATGNMTTSSSLLEHTCVCVQQYANTHVHKRIRDNEFNASASGMSVCEHRIQCL